MKNVTDISKVETAIKDRDAVIMNVEDYNQKMLEEDIVKHLLRAEDDIKNGRVRDAREVFAEWEKEYGI